MNKLPILFLVFNRKDIALESLKSIRNYKPSKLYIAADGPRKNKPNEEKVCDEVRQAIINSIDWECEIHTLFRTENLGCAKAVNEAITWFFENVEYGIIVEDDCVLHPDFYKLCDIYLPFYTNEEKIMLISAHNVTPDLNKADELVFTNIAYIWGWATWRRAWNKMDMSMKRWKEISLVKLIKDFGIIQGVMRYYHWHKTYTNLEESTSWATRWCFNVYINNGLCLLSNANLTKNTGTTSKGTHYQEGDENPYKHLSYGSISWPLKEPTIEISKGIIKAERKEFKRLKYIGLKKKIKKLLK